jgi:hypothetical protein
MQFGVIESDDDERHDHGCDVRVVGARLSGDNVIFLDIDIDIDIHDVDDHDD